MKVLRQLTFMSVVLDNFDKSTLGSRRAGQKLLSTLPTQGELLQALD